MHIQTNTTSLIARNNLSKTTGALGTAIERLSSGLRINSAKDDAAGLAISNRMTSRIKGGEQAQKNVRDGMSMMQTAESALNEMNSNLQRVRELTVQGLNKTLSAADVQSVQKEINERLEEIDRLGNTTSFNGIGLFNQTKELSLQVGANASDVFPFNVEELDLWSLGLSTAKGPFLLDGAIGRNPLPVGPPLTQVELTNHDRTFDYLGAEINLGDGSGYLSFEQTAAHFEIPLDQITIHRPLNPETNEPLSNYFVVKVGESYYLQPPTSFNVDLVNGTAKARMTIRGDLFYTDPENGVTTPQPTIKKNLYAQVGVLDNGTVVQFYSYMGKEYLRSAVGSGPLVLSGPGANSVNINFTTPPTENPLAKLDAAIAKIDGLRSYMGASQNRLESMASGLAQEGLNLHAARSRIQDADYAVEVSAMTRNQILQQAGQSVLAQANQIPQGVLALLR